MTGLPVGPAAMRLDMPSHAAGTTRATRVRRCGRIKQNCEFGLTDRLRPHCRRLRPGALPPRADTRNRRIESCASQFKRQPKRTTSSSLRLRSATMVFRSQPRTSGTQARTLALGWLAHVSTSGTTGSR